MHRATGGYLVTPQPLVRTGWVSHTTALDRPVSQVDIDALNAVQETPWRINRWLLDVLAKAFADGLEVAGLGGDRLPALPPRFSDEAWTAMSEEARKAHTATLRDLHSARATITGRRQALLDKLQVAQEMRDYPAIWFPHTKDFRGRIYPLPVAGPHPQSDDVGKALLMFAEGVPLGEDGEFWLCVRAANAFGMDKLPLEERVEWALNHAAYIHGSAQDPLKSTWWTNAEEPWSFLATCRELEMVWSLWSTSPQDFVSHLPCPMDGSCNGLQHLSAMGLDPIGASATNLTPGDRQDIYEEVAKHVRVAVEADIASGNPIAAAWDGQVTRQVVKRAVMTTPYGVTDSGIRTQLINDGHASTGPSADYLRDRLVEALGATIQAGKAIMGWLQEVAQALAKAGVPFDWTTPTGSQCRQAYYSSSLRRVKTLCGSLVLADETTTGILVAKKQALGAAPNFVHSFDAAHLSLTVNEAARSGMTSFAMIHDSFGTHAAHTTRLARILRETFVDIYREDWLTRLHDEVRTYAPHVPIPTPPARGDFDIEQVLGSVFFFS